MLPTVNAFNTYVPLAGLRITEVSHDIQQQVSHYVTEQGLVNSYDTWHGMVKVCSYAIAVSMLYLHTHQEQKMWESRWQRSHWEEWGTEQRLGFQSLLTRVSVLVCAIYCRISNLCCLIGKNVKTHLYRAMKNCECSADCLRSLISSIPSHYSVQH